MIFFLLFATVTVNIEIGGAVRECSTSEPIEYFPGVRFVTIIGCEPAVLFADGFEG